MTNILHQLERAEDDANLAFLRSEVARLRLTDAEREAIQAAAVIMDARNRLGGPVMFRGSERAAALRGLLERLGDCPTPDNAADRNNGPTGSGE